MERKRTNRTQRLAAGILGLLVLLVLLLSAAFLAKEAHHDCVGEDCPICAAMAACESLLRHLLCGLFPAAKAPIALCLLSLSAALSALVGAAETPVSQKVRLNN